jgi:elongator complex protein 1
LPHLLQFTAEHRDKGLGLQNEVEAFEIELKEDIEEIWNRPVEENGVDGASWAPRTEVKSVDPVEKVVKPDISQGNGWKVKLFDVK